MLLLLCTFLPAQPNRPSHLEDTTPINAMPVAVEDSLFTWSTDRLIGQHNKMDLVKPAGLRTGEKTETPYGTGSHTTAAGD